uniref:G-protein coupled receptors family 1 profile domain-containing protein n=1 Tax=Oryzias sinensis TaxID=183150 RepID=A0A8C8DZ47_9TELE
MSYNIFTNIFYNRYLILFNILTCVSCLPCPPFSNDSNAMHCGSYAMHSGPNYVAIFNLAFVDLLGNTALVPKVIDIFLFNHYYISYGECLTFFFFLHHLPFNAVRVTPKIMLSIVAFIWLFVLTCVLIALGLLTRLSFCDSVVINSFYCDHGPMYRLACNDQTPNLVHGNLLIALILWVPLIIIVSSYVCIGHTLAKISTAHERIKAFKTCTAHLSLVAIYFIPVLTVYNMRANIHPNARIINLSMTTVFPPMLNPIIYVLQTQEIRGFADEGKLLFSYTTLV